MALSANILCSFTPSAGTTKKQSSGQNSSKRQGGDENDMGILCSCGSQTSLCLWIAWES